MTTTSIYSPTGKLLYSFGGDWINSWSTIAAWVKQQFGTEPELCETDEGDMLMVHGRIVGRIG